MLFYGIYWPLAYNFVIGSVHTARAVLRNPGAQSRSYNGKLYLGKHEGNEVASASKSFTLDGGEQKDIDFSVTMPDVPDTYHVYLNIHEAGELVGAYQAIEDVTISLPPAVFAIQKFFVVTIPRGRGSDCKGKYEIHCLIKNEGEGTGTRKITLYADGNIVENKTLTLAPGETYDYIYSWGMAPCGASGIVWVVGDWGEETPHIYFTAGYYTTSEVTVDCTAVTDTTAVLRFAAQSVTQKWKVAYCTPPGWSNIEQRGSFTVRASGGWSAMWCALTRLLSQHRYEADISGYDYGTRSGSTEFTTR